MVFVPAGEEHRFIDVTENLESDLARAADLLRGAIGQAEFEAFILHW